MSELGKITREQFTEWTYGNLKLADWDIAAYVKSQWDEIDRLKMEPNK